VGQRPTGLQLAGLIEARMFLAMAASGPEVLVEQVVDEVAQSVAFLASLVQPNRQ
jgi:hypothetical protein